MVLPRRAAMLGFGAVVADAVLPASAQTTGSHSPEGAVTLGAQQGQALTNLGLMNYNQRDRVAFGRYTLPDGRLAIIGAQNGRVVIAYGNDEARVTRVANHNTSCFCANGQPFFGVGRAPFVPLPDAMRAIVMGAIPALPRAPDPLPAAPATEPCPPGTARALPSRGGGCVTLPPPTNG